MGKPNKPDYNLPKSLKKVINFNVNDCHCDVGGDDNNLNPTGIYFAGDVAGHLGSSIASALNHGFNIIKDIKEKNH